MAKIFHSSQKTLKNVEKKQEYQKIPRVKAPKHQPKNVKTRFACYGSHGREMWLEFSRKVLLFKLTWKSPKKRQKPKETFTTPKNFPTQETPKNPPKKTKHGLTYCVNLSRKEVCQRFQRKHFQTKLPLDSSKIFEKVPKSFHKTKTSKNLHAKNTYWPIRKTKIQTRFYGTFSVKNFRQWSTKNISGRVTHKTSQTTLKTPNFKNEILKKSSTKIGKKGKKIRPHLLRHRPPY